MTTAIDNLKRDQAALLNELAQAGAEIVKPTAIRCPFHEDRHPSAAVYEGEDGAWRFKCHTDSCGFHGDVFDVRARREGKTAQDVMREINQADAAPARPKTAAPKSSKPKRVYPSVEAIRDNVPTVREIYQYTNPGTLEPDMVVLRQRLSDGRKSFMQARPVDGGFTLEAPVKPWPIYNRIRVASAGSVLVVEGEKCVHAAHTVGIVATTNPGGAGKAEHADWSPLAGKAVYLWPDCDEPDHKTHERTGFKHMRAVAKLLEQLDPAPRVYWIDPDQLGLPVKGDVADYLDQHVDVDDQAKRAAVELVMQDATPLGASGEVKAMLEDTISGRRRPIVWPWDRLSRLTRALLPGTVTIICGDPGSSKSFLLLEAAAYWHEQGIKVAIFELEEDRRYHLYRALAQRSRASHLFDEEWVSQNGDQARHLFGQHRDFLDSFGRCIHEAPDNLVTLDELADWVERMALDGRRIIAIDPVTAAESSDKPWIDDLKFLMRVKTIVRQTESSLVLVTHPRKGRKGSGTLDDLAGGAAYARFSQTVLWLDLHEPAESMTIRSRLGYAEEVTANRSFKLRKTRNGPGAGHQIAMRLDGGSLCFEEFGVVIDESEV